MARELARERVARYIKIELNLIGKLKQTITIEQFFTFTDARTSCFDEIPKSALHVRNSGFKIEYTIERIMIVQNMQLIDQYWVRIQKSPLANHDAESGLMLVSDSRWINDRVK